MSDQILIENSKFRKFIANNQNLTNCQKDNFVKLLDNRNKFFVDKKSNKQIKTYLLTASKYNNIQQIVRFKLLLYNFFNPRFTEELVSMINKKSTITDQQIIKYIQNTNPKKRIVEFNKKFPDRIEPCYTWTYIIENISLNLLKIFNNGYQIPINKIKYLDIGSGGGNKTMKMGKELSIDKTNIYATDIAIWGKYDQKKISHEFNFKLMEKGGKIPYESGLFDLVSCFLMLHHVESLDKFLDEIVRVVKPGGYLLIVEHTNYDDYDNLLLDILHMLYGYLHDKNNRYLASPDYANYYNWLEWDYIFDKKGFVLVKSNYLITGVSNTLRYDNIFYSIYQKK